MKNSGFFLSLAWENIRRNRAIYGPYLLAGAVCSGLIYTLNAISEQLSSGDVRWAAYLSMNVNFCVWFCGLLVLLILLIILQQLDSRVIAPRVLGRTVEVSAFWILFAIVIGGTLLGPIGMVLGVPAFVTLYGLLRGVIYWVLDRRGVTARDLDGAPQPPTAEEEKETANV